VRPRCRLPVANADRYLLGISGDMQSFEKTQLESGFPVTGTAGPRHYRTGIGENRIGVFRQ
jgi:hypothetical protein